MDIQETRRHNLNAWLRTHSVPPAEKSYFSQLRSGASFGEKAARRLEEAYGMGSGFLDRPVGNSPKRGQKPFLSDEAESLIQEVIRLDGLSVLARKMFPIVRSMLALSVEPVERNNHVTGKHQISARDAREAEKALSAKIEGPHEQHGRRAKGR